MEVIKRSELDRNGIPLPDTRKLVTLLSEGLEEVQTPPIGIPNETQDRGLIVRGRISHRSWHGNHSTDQVIREDDVHDRPAVDQSSSLEEVLVLLLLALRIQQG